MIIFNLPLLLLLFRKSGSFCSSFRHLIVHSSFQLECRMLVDPAGDLLYYISDCQRQLYDDIKVSFVCILKKLTTFDARYKINF